MQASDDQDDRRNRFLPDGGGGGGGAHRDPPAPHTQRAASQPPHHSTPPFLSSPPTTHLVPSAAAHGHGHSHGPWNGLLSSSSRSTSFSSSRFPSTFEDDELVDPDDELYDARYGSGQNQYRGRPVVGAPDLSRSRSQSLATTAPVGAGRQPGGYNPNANIIGSAANSYSNSYLYGNNAHGGHMYAASRYGSLGGGSPLAQSLLRGASLRDRERDRDDRDRGGDGTNMSPFVRDVGTILLDDGSFRELWERERGGNVNAYPGSYGGKGGGGVYDDRDLDVGPGSGATSRRHSVSGVQPRRLTGFTAPESGAGGAGFTSGTGGGGGGGNGLAFPSTLAGRGGGLLLSDDDLEGALGSLSLNTHSLGGGGRANGGGAMSPASLTNRYFDAERERERDRYFEDLPVGNLPRHPHDPQPGSLPIHAPQAMGRAPSLGMERSTSGVGAGGISKDWADAYFSPPREPVAVNVNLGRGGDAFPQYEGAGGAGGGGYRARAPSAASNAGPPLSPTAGTGRGFAGGFTAPQHPQQPVYSHSHVPAPHTDIAKPQIPLAEMGKGLPLHAVPPEWPLYIVEFKAGRTDLFYRASDRERAAAARNGTAPPRTDPEADAIRVGDLVIVEADRGKDLGKVVNDSITIGEVEAYWAGQARFGGSGQSPPTSPGGANDGGGSSGKKEIAPKMIYGKAGSGDAHLLVAKMQDEVKALALCQTKVRAKKLPMEVVDAEYQWDRRKLTFYFVAEKRIDFRELVRELFRLYKTRIWMASLQGASGLGGGGAYDQ